MNNQRNLFFNVDWVTILIYLTLCIIGWFNIHAAVLDPIHPGIMDLSTNYGKQLLYILSALVLGFFILIIDSKFYNSFSPIFYGLTILLLVVVLVVGRNVGGNQAWIPLGSFRLQPSEFAKFSTCLLLARYLSSTTTKVQDFKTILSCAAIIILPVVLIMMQPDTGSALVFTSLIFVLYREGLSGYFLLIEGLSIVLFVLTLLYNKFYVLAGVVVFAAILIYFLKRNRSAIQTVIIGVIYSLCFIFSVDFAYNNILKSHQKTRIDVILGKVDDPRGQGYNLNQSKIAIGSGRLWGKGYLQGTQTKYDFVPEQSTDFIFCTVGEEWGFAGSFVLIGLYLFLLLRIIFLAERQRSTFSRVYGYGVASIIFFHFFINLGMTIGLIPVIGIPLPFISYGGSSLWSFTILLFILLKLDSNRMGIV
ncbi:rod shape-determining protein RodA [Pedobacter sp. HMF7647]|uniref:Cell wall polymerase n=1 Tax=Hufsiella arboris TaxID=2695275 RepID=A0A7K1Y9M9_9SPHI|nr:rod shape-determining protein RodA [Hufsiella arboris]MXV51130.1 rod shape-determining protein RodA [Hufsiella arboris]